MKTKIFKKFHKNHKNIFKLGLIASFFVVNLTTIPVFADNSSINVNINTDSLVLDLTPKSTEGTFVKSSDINIGISVTGPGGYTLNIRSSSGEICLYNTTNEECGFESISEAVSESDFNSSSDYINKWGYLPSKLNSEANTNFQPAPNEVGDTLDYVDDDNDTSGDYTISFGAKANLNTPTGSYSNDTFVITAVANLSCNPSASSIQEARCMQDLNSNTNQNAEAIIESMEFDKQYQLRDNRDWKTYYLAKMKDGRVWMTQNLDLDLTTPDNENYIELNGENTDLYWEDGGGVSDIWEPNRGTIDESAESEEDLYWEDSYSDPISIDVGEKYYYPNDDGTVSLYTSLASCEAEHNDGTCPHYHAGNYYNWLAAVTLNEDISSSASRNEVMPNSICPAGWRLPRGADVGLGFTIEYSDLAYTLKKEGIIYNFDEPWAEGEGLLKTTPLYYPIFSYIGNHIDPAERKTSLYWYGSTGNSWLTVQSPGVAFRNTFYLKNDLRNQSYAIDNIIGTYGMASAYGIDDNPGGSIRCLVRQENTGITTVAFDKNAEDTSGTMSSQTYYANTINTLPANGFTRSGYAFNGWNTKSDGSGDSFADEGEYYAITGTNANNITLYAQWDKLITITFATQGATGINFNDTVYTDGQTTLARPGQAYRIYGVYDTKYGLNNWSATTGFLENVSSPITTFTPTEEDATITLTGEEAAQNISTLTNSSDPVSSTCKNDPVSPELVYDPRDNEAYYVARLCDGNYWMLDNLRLDLTNQTVINALNSNNTNATTTQLNYLKNGGGSTTDQYPTAGLSGSNWTSGASFSVPQANNTYKNDVAPVTYGLGFGKTGVYYNYCAASSGTYCWGNGSSYNGSPTTDPDTNSYRDISGDICPKGWHLPTGNYNSGTTRVTEYGTLYASYSGASLGQGIAMRDALSASLSGYFNGSSRSGFGSSSSFLSSTWNNTSRVYSAYSTSTSINPGSTSDRRYGYSIRCMLN